MKFFIIVSTNGFLIPANPLHLESHWICCANGCKETHSVEKIITQVYQMQKVFETIKSQKFGDFEKIEELERLLKVAEKKLHPNHYLILDIRMCIIKLEIPFVNCLQKDALQTLIKHTRSLLSIANILAIGFSQTRGTQ